MDGKGSWRDNVFVERLWRTIKYDEVYLKAYDSVSEARASIGRFIDFYNSRRPHSSLDRKTPDQAYFDGLAQGRPLENFSSHSGRLSGRATPSLQDARNAITTGRGSTYKMENSVQTNPASSIDQCGLRTHRQRQADTSPDFRC